MAKSPKLQALVDRFVNELHQLFVDQAGAALRSTLGGDPARGAGTSVVHNTGRPTKARRARGGGKRTSEEIEAQAAKVLRLITDNPGKRSEDLAPLVGLSTKELVGPLKRLLVEKKIKASGRARGTSYVISGRQPRKASSKSNASSKSPSAAQ